MNARRMRQLLHPRQPLRQDRDKVNHLQAAKLAIESGFRVIWCGVELGPGDKLPPWWTIGGKSRFRIINQETT